MVIYKYVLSDNDNIKEMLMSRDAKILSVGLQNDVPVIWATVEPLVTIVTRKFETFYTGERFYPDGKVYVGTVQKSDGIVLHIFEVVS